MGKTGQLTVFWGRSALDLADHLWFSYLGGRRRGVRRLFGRAWLDGVDLFLELDGPVEHYDALARELARRKARGGKAPRLTATPRSAFPDRLAALALSSGVFERIHVRFYDSCRAVEPACAGCRREAGGGARPMASSRRGGAGPAQSRQLRRQRGLGARGGSRPAGERETGRREAASGAGVERRRPDGDAEQGRSRAYAEQAALHAGHRGLAGAHRGHVSGHRLGPRMLWVAGATGEATLTARA